MVDVSRKEQHDLTRRTFLSRSGLGIALTGSDTATRYLLVSETWYKDWHALVDGRQVGDVFAAVQAALEEV